ncbi:Na+/H+ antiporter subunit E [Candidatus Foliamicus sp.]
MRSKIRRKTPRQAFPQGTGGRWLRAQFVLALLLVAAWLLWSGMFKPLILGLGVFSCALTLYLVRRMGYFDTRVYAFRYSLRLVGFWFWLLGEIARSSIEVARIVLSRPMRLKTEVVELPVEGFDAVDKALLGNSITLAPGSLTLDVRKDVLVVHSLTGEGAQAIREGEMKRRVAALRSP